MSKSNEPVDSEPHGFDGRNAATLSISIANSEGNSNGEEYDSIISESTSGELREATISESADGINESTGILTRFSLWVGY